MPTTVVGSPSIVIERPRIAGSPPSRDCQNSSLSRRRAARQAGRPPVRSGVRVRRSRRASGTDPPVTYSCLACTASLARLTSAVPCEIADRSVDLASLAREIDVVRRGLRPRPLRPGLRRDSVHGDQAVAVANGSGWSSARLIALEIAVVAPIPSARHRIADTDTVGVRTSARDALRNSVNVNIAESPGSGVWTARECAVPHWTVRVALGLGSGIGMRRTWRATIRPTPVVDNDSTRVVNPGALFRVEGDARSQDRAAHPAPRAPRLVQVAREKQS